MNWNLRKWTKINWIKLLKSCAMNCHRMMCGWNVNIVNCIRNLWYESNNICILYIFSCITDRNWTTQPFKTSFKWTNCELSATAWLMNDFYHFLYEHLFKLSSSSSSSTPFIIFIYTKLVNKNLVIPFWTHFSINF